MPKSGNHHPKTTFGAMLAVWLVAAMLAGTSLAAPLDDAKAADKRGDYATALRLYQPLANEGDSDAEFSLGRMYYNGQGVPHNNAEAVKWFHKAANQGHALAQLYLGVMYAGGLGEPQDYAEAVKWYRKAADQGNGTAQNFLGLTYYTGQGVPQDYVQAHKWFNLSEEKISWAVRMRDQVESMMTPAQIAEAQKLAREWKPK